MPRVIRAGPQLVTGEDLYILTGDGSIYLVTCIAGGGSTQLLSGWKTAYTDPALYDAWELAVSNNSALNLKAYAQTDPYPLVVAHGSSAATGWTFPWSDVAIPDTTHFQFDLSNRAQGWFFADPPAEDRPTLVALALARFTYVMTVLYNDTFFTDPDALSDFYTDKNIYIQMTGDGGATWSAVLLDNIGQIYPTQLYHLGGAGSPQVATVVDIGENYGRSDIEALAGNYTLGHRHWNANGAGGPCQWTNAIWTVGTETYRGYPDFHMASTGVPPYQLPLDEWSIWWPAGGGGVAPDFYHFIGQDPAVYVYSSMSWGGTWLCSGADIVDLANLGVMEPTVEWPICAPLQNGADAYALVRCKWTDAHATFTGTWPNFQGQTWTWCPFPFGWETIANMPPVLHYEYRFYKVAAAGTRTVQTLAATAADWFVDGATDPLNSDRLYTLDNHGEIGYLSWSTGILTPLTAPWNTATDTPQRIRFSTAGTLFVAVIAPGNTFMMYRSVDGGANWTATDLSPLYLSVPSYEFVVSADGQIIAIVNDGDWNVIFSRDDGLTWQVTTTLDFGSSDPYDWDTAH